MTTELVLHDEEVRSLLNRIHRRIGDIREGLEAVGDEAVLGITENFEAQGRFSSPDNVIGGPRKWKEHAKSTRKILEKRKFARPFLILQRYGALKNSISKQGGRDSVVVGTNKEYAAMQHFGAKKGEFGIQKVLIKAHKRKGSKKPVKSHFRRMQVPWGDIPAFPPHPRG